MIGVAVAKCLDASPEADRVFASTVAWKYEQWVQKAVFGGHDAMLYPGSAQVLFTTRSAFNRCNNLRISHPQLEEV